MRMHENAIAFLDTQRTRARRKAFANTVVPECEIHSIFSCDEFMRMLSTFVGVKKGRSSSGLCAHGSTMASLRCGLLRQQGGAPREQPVPDRIDFLLRQELAEVRHAAAR